MTLHILSSFVSILIYAVTLFILWFKINDPRLVLFSFSFLMVNAFACEWYYYGTEQFRFITSRSVITRVCGLASIFILIRQPADYYIYYGIIAATGIVNIAWNLGGLLTRLRVQLFNGSWQMHIRRTWVTYSISLMYSVSLMLDNVLLGLVSAAAFVAFYAFAVKLVRLASSVLTDTLLVFFPHAVTLLHQQEKTKFQQAILRNIQLLNLFSLPIGVGLFFLSEEITSVIFGPSFSPVAADLRILCVVPFIRCYNLFLSKQVLMAYDNERLYLKSLLFSGLIFVASTIILSYLYQDKGASVAMVLYECSLLIFNYYFVKKTDRHLKVFDWKSVVQAILGAAVFVPLIFLARRWLHADWLWLCLIIGTCAAVYMSFLLFVLKNELMISLRVTGLKYFDRLQQNGNT
jgi:O-antigen/teichoic acid export membrane protein